MEHTGNNQDILFCDLHNHLYGCLSAERLYSIGRNNPNPRWHIFTQAYETAFGQAIHPETFFQTYDTLAKFAALYHFNHRGPFPEFQAKFNLIIALVEFTISEMREVASQVVLDHARQNVHHSEYRIMFAKDETRPLFEERIRAVCEGILEGESLARCEGKTIHSSIAFSLHRSGLNREHYQWIKELMEKSRIVKEKLTGLDFCYIEEGYPPRDKKDFFAEVIRDNQAEPATALALLYHVGESYQDKTPFSAARWVLESALQGAHRLGHCIALGIRPQVFLGKTRTESIPERIHQLEWELENYNEIRNSGDYYSQDEIEKEHKRLLNAPVHSHPLELVLGEKDCHYLETFQNYCMSRIARTPAVIESCPSSNYYIGMIETPADHPLPRFVQSALPVTIASDDPGIFATTIQEEYAKAREMGISEADLNAIRTRSIGYASERLSGRKFD